MNIFDPVIKQKVFAKWTLLTGLMAALCFQAHAPAEWERPLQPSLAGGGLVCLSAHPLDASKFLVANRSQLFEGSGALGWKTLWANGDHNAGIEKILTFPWIPDHVFLIASGKVFMGSLKTDEWLPIYDRGSQTEKTPLSFSVMPDDPNQWFVGTRKGLWMSKNAGKTWSRADIFPLSNMVSVLFVQGNKLFIGTESSLLLSLNGSPAREVITLTKKEAVFDSAGIDEEAEIEDGTFYIQKLRALIVDDTDPAHLFLGTLSGAFESRDGGYHWRPLSRSGMQSTEVLSLAYSPKTRRLFAATPDGVYEYRPKDETWKALSDGVARPYSKSVAVVNEEKLIAVTGDGFVEYQIKPEIGPAVTLFEPSGEALSLFRKLISFEPTARETQKRVVWYADVGNGKIKRWHAMSRLAGLLPTFSFGKDFSRSPSIDLDRGGTNDADRYILGPDDVSRSWDANVSWDLGDTLYSSDQTSIDSREKLMVELRQDLLSEMTRIYFERRRLQTDVVFTPSFSEQEHLERLLRLDELTALLDGMTDGFFSKRLDQIYERNDELNRLWIYQSVSENRDSGSRRDC